MSTPESVSPLPESPLSPLPESPLSPLPRAMVQGSLSPLPRAMVQGSLSPLPRAMVLGSLSPLPRAMVQGCNENVIVSLEEKDLWRKFHQFTNEMIVTKVGRRMFPVVKSQITGLEPDAMYSVYMEFVQLDSHKWRYANGSWSNGGRSEPPPNKCTYQHPDSPNFGCHWMKDIVSFATVKISNKKSTEQKCITLNSLHKYEPRIYIMKVSNGGENNNLLCNFRLPLAQFIAVTAYQNEEVTNLKIRHNPYAKTKTAEHEMKPKTERTTTCQQQLNTTAYPQPADEQQYSNWYNQQQQYAQQQGIYNSYSNSSSAVGPMYTQRNGSVYGYGNRISPYTTPYSAPYSTPYSAPYSTPYTTPYSAGDDGRISSTSYNSNVSTYEPCYEYQPVDNSQSVYNSFAPPSTYVNQQMQYNPWPCDSSTAVSSLQEPTSSEYSPTFKVEAPTPSPDLPTTCTTVYNTTCTTAYNAPNNMESLYEMISSSSGSPATSPSLP